MQPVVYADCCAPNATGPPEWLATVAWYYGFWPNTWRDGHRELCSRRHGLDSPGHLRRCERRRHRPYRHDRPAHLEDRPGIEDQQHHDRLRADDRRSDVPIHRWPAGGWTDELRSRDRRRCRIGPHVVDCHRRSCQSKTHMTRLGGALCSTRGFRETRTSRWISSAATAMSRS
jgi:hypothetical protein